MDRLRIEVAVVLLIAMLAVAGVLHLRHANDETREALSSKSAEDVRGSEDSAHDVPVELDSVAVAARAADRVNRLAGALNTQKPPQSSAVEGPNVMRRAAGDAIARLKSIRACERNADGLRAKGLAGCPDQSALAKADPGGYDAVLVEQTVAELAFLRRLAEKEERESMVPSFSVGEVARAYIRHPDDNVREQALGLASLLVAREPGVAVEIASRAVSETVSGPLARQALEVLSESRTANPGLVDKTLIQTLRTGGWEVRDAVAEKILPFLTRENRPAFAKLQAKAPLRSRLSLRLRLNIEEFDRMERL